MQRTLPLLLLVTSVQACVIPLGPDFQDPAAAKNLPPQILTPIPAFLTEVNQPSFQVTVTDPNVGDDLNIRWFSDFPGPSNTIRRLGAMVPFIQHSKDGTQKMTTVGITPTCSADRIASGITLHTIVVMVADHDFDDSTDDLTDLVGGGQAVYAGWLLNLDCPPL